MISPRRLPPPTFEKILLGLADSDFALDNDDADVFGDRDSPTRPEIVADHEKEECISDSVEPDEPHGGTHAYRLRANLRVGWPERRRGLKGKENCV